MIPLIIFAFNVKAQSIMSIDSTTGLRDIMHYESDIWAIADLLLATSIKQSDFPTYMMPLFALTMLEGRMLNAIKEVEKEEGLTAKDDPEDLD